MQTRPDSLTKPASLTTDNLCKPEQAGTSIFQQKSANHLNPLEVYEDELGVFLNGYLSLMKRYCLWWLMLSYNYLSGVLAFRFQWGCSARLLWPLEWDNFKIFQLSPCYTSLPFVDTQVSTPRLIYVEIFFWCFLQTGFLLSLSHSVNIIMDNISQCYLSTSVTSFPFCLP